MPFVIYYLVYMGAYIVMATLAGMFVRNASAGLIRSLSGYEATVNAMIGGIAMLIGITGYWQSGDMLPSFPLTVIV